MIPLVILGVILLGTLLLILRGTWAETVVKTPTHLAQSPVTQLYRDAENATQVRCAILVAAAPQDAWAVITDYPNHPKFLPSVSALTSEPLEDGRFKVAGIAHSRIWGDWPFENKVRQEENPVDEKYATSWDESGKGFVIDRGSWTVSRAGESQSLLVFTLQVELESYPNFLVRNVIMDRMPAILRAMRDEILRRQRASQASQPE
jgi:hypothetical protein